MSKIGEIDIRRVGRKWRIGCYRKKSEKPVSRALRQEAEAATFRGKTVMGVNVSTYSPSLLFGVFITTRRGLKLLSRHATLELAAVAAKEAWERMPEAKSSSTACILTKQQCQPAGR